MRRLLLLSTLFAASGCFCGPGPESYRRDDGSLTIANDSSFVLVDIRVTPVSSSSWGPSLLRDVLYPGEQISVGVPCGTYDVLIVDERDRDCQLASLSLCFSDQLWVIDNRTLYSCGWGRF